MRFKIGTRNHPRRESRDPRKRDGFAGFHDGPPVSFTVFWGRLDGGWYWDAGGIALGPFRSSRAAYIDAIRGG